MLLEHISLEQILLEHILLEHILLEQALLKHVLLEQQIPLAQMSLEENVNMIFFIRVNGLKTTIL